MLVLGIVSALGFEYLTAVVNRLVSGLDFPIRLTFTISNVNLRLYKNTCRRCVGRISAMSRCNSTYTEKYFLVIILAQFKEALHMRVTL